MKNLQPAKVGLNFYFLRVEPTFATRNAMFHVLILGTEPSQLTVHLQWQQMFPESRRVQSSLEAS